MSRPPSEGLELAGEGRVCVWRGGGGVFEALQMRVFFPKRPQSWETRPAAGRAGEEPDGMRSSVAAAGSGPGRSPGPHCSPGPSEDGEMRWDLPRGTEGP